MLITHLPYKYAMFGAEQRTVDCGSPVEMAPTQWRTNFRCGGEKTSTIEENDHAISLLLRRSSQ